MGCDAEGSSLVGGGDEPEQELGTGVVQRGESELVDQDEVVAEQGVDDLADRVVGESSVEGLDQVGGGEVPDPMPGFDGGDPEPDEGVGLVVNRPG